MKMKALASDFDRTLFFYDESGSYYRLEDVQAIKHFQSLGNLFGVCTGRSYKGIEDFNPHQIDYDFYILCSGAKILDKEGNLIYQKFIDKKIAQSIYEQYEAVDTSIVYQGDMYVLNRTFDLSPRVKLITSFNQVGEQFEAFSLHFKNNDEAGKEYTKMIDIPIVAPHSAKPTIVHESYHEAAAVPIRTGIVNFLDATKKLLKSLLAFLCIANPTDKTPTK